MMEAEFPFRLQAERYLKLYSQLVSPQRQHAKRPDRPIG